MERRKFVINKTIFFGVAKCDKNVSESPAGIVLCDVEHLALMEIFNAIRSFTSVAQDQHQMCFLAITKSAAQHSPLTTRRFRPHKAKCFQLECCTFIFALAKYPGRLMQISLVLECICEKKIERLHSTATTTTSISSRVTLVIGTYKATKHIFISEGAFDLRTTLDAHFLKVPSLNNKLAS